MGAGGSSGLHARRLPAWQVQGRPPCRREARETRATELWDLVSDERLTREQQEKFRGFTWARENLDKNPSDDDAKRMNNLHRVRITVTWGMRGQGRGKKEQESYVTLWRKPAR